MNGRKGLKYVLFGLFWICFFTGLSLRDVNAAVSIVPPKGLAAKAVSSSQIDLKWKASTGANSYNVYQSTSSSGTYKKINISPLTTPNYSNSGLAASTKYYYKVTALYGTRESGKSAGVSATTSAAPINNATPYWVENDTNFVIDRQVKFADKDGIYSPIVSPDGNYVAYSHGGQNLIVADLKTKAKRSIYLEKDSSFRVYPEGWSPDSSKILFMSQYSSVYLGSNRLMTISRKGGAAKQILQGLSTADWGPEGNIVVAKSSEISIMDLSGKKSLTLNTPESGWLTYADYPTFTPDGKNIIYNCGDDYYIHNLADNSYRLLFNTGNTVGSDRVNMATNGKLFYAISGAVWVYDDSTREQPTIYYDKADCSYAGCSKAR
jgi:Periplasmic component of the Tol biopolymer transport system